MEISPEIRERIMKLLEAAYPLRALLIDKDETESNAILNWIIDAGEVVEFGEKESIYLPGDAAEYMYLLVDGVINLNLPVKKTNESFGLLEAGDLFGIEAADARGIYLLEAFTKEEGSMFCLGRETIFALMDENPILDLPFKMMMDSLRLSLKVELSWRSPREAIHFLARRHPIFLLLRLFFPILVFFAGFSLLVYFTLAAIPGTLLFGLAAGLVAFLGGCWTVWNYLDWGNDYSVITSQHVVFQEKVILLYDSRMQAPLTAVLSNKINSTQVGRIVGYGDLVMKTYTGTIAFPDVSHPEIVVNILEDRFKRISAQHSEKEKRELRNQIRERLKFIPPAPKWQKPKPPANKALPFREWLGTIFRMRWESGGTITYRKHLLILLADLLFPSLFLIALIFATALTITGLFKIIGITAQLALEFVLFLIGCFWWWYQYEDWANDVYVVSDDSVVDIYKKPLGFEEKRTAEVRNIQSVEYDRENLAHLLFNFGDVRIRIGDTQFDFENVYNPSDVTADLFRRIDRRKGMDKKRQDDEMHRHLVDLAESYHRVMGNPFEKEDLEKKKS